MGIIELVLISVGLAMDAFAVAVCKGLNMRRINYKHAVIIAAFFGGFQALMPFLGWLIGTRFASYIDKYDHYVAFALLAFIGVKMIIDAVKGEEECEECKDSDKLDIKELLVLAVATSIDALAVGVTFALLPELNVGWSVAIIGVITFLISALGVVIGNRFGSKYQQKAELAGGIILILIGVKFLLEGFGVINF
ncbi:MAG: manganese efflux pump [Clostridia bacterium]|nr:manganese efflux pump [Clostridia bacterium]